MVKNSGEEKVFIVVECHNNICYNSKRILEKGVLILNYYLVDYENVNKTGLNGVAKLDKDDVVCIFYSENADSLTFGLHRRLNESAAEIIYKKVVIGNKNALDFQLSSYLGYIIHENESEGKQYDYYIVSKDKAFEKDNITHARTYRCRIHNEHIHTCYRYNARECCICAGRLHRKQEK